MKHRIHGRHLDQIECYGREWFVRSDDPERQLEKVLDTDKRRQAYSLLPNREPKSR
jgi:hypothetical protein